MVAFIFADFTTCLISNEKNSNIDQNRQTANKLT